MTIFVLRNKLNPYGNFEGDMQFYLTFNTSSRHYCHLSVPFLCPQIIGGCPLAGSLRRSWMRFTVYVYVSVVRFTLTFLNSCRKLLSLRQGCACGNGFCPWKGILYNSVCKNKYRDRCAMWGFNP